MYTRKTKELRKEPVIFADYFLRKERFLRVVFFAWKFFCFGINYKILKGVHCKDSLHLYEYITFYLLLFKIPYNSSAKKL